MILAPSDPTGAAWNEAVLHGLGAATISHTDEGIVVAPDISLTGYAAALATFTQVALAAYAASARYAKETGGLKVGTAQIDTSRESQAMIANAYQFMQVSGAASAQYKTDSGWVSVSSDQMKAIALAVGAHVQACFAAEQDLDARITAGTVTSTAQIDAALAAVST